MDVAKVLENSHTLLLQTVEGVPESEWEIPGVCGEWSVKDVVSHLAAYERLLIDILNTALGNEASPYMRTFLANPEGFNTHVAEAREYQPAQQVLVAYQEAQVQSTSLLAQIPEGSLQTSLKTQQGEQQEQQSVADIINKISLETKEHCDQIAQFRERRKQEETSS